MNESYGITGKPQGHYYVDPYYALVRFKKLSGGGYFKIISGAVPNALKTSGYSQKVTDAIEKYAVGAASFDGAPFINTQTLLVKVFLNDVISKLNATAKIRF